jgi:hypothetical protein
MADSEAVERAAAAEYQRQTHETTPEQRAGALHVAIRAFQATLAIEGAREVNDYLALCELLGEALDEYGDGLDGRRDTDPMSEGPTE